MKITIFTVPKAFTGHFGIIQENALNSWLRILPQPEILVFGDEKGFMSSLRGKHLRWLPFIKKNKFGTPVLNSVFDQAQIHAHGDVLVYVNSDIILDQSLVSSLEKVKLDRFLVIGRRWNLRIKKRLVFDKKWDEKRDEILNKHGKLFRQDGLDYFAYPKGIVWCLLPFALGRTLWDNYIPFRAKQIGAKVIDATDSIIAIHQEHDYSHAGGPDNVLRGQERKTNLSLVFDRRCFFSLYDADYVLSAKGVRHKRLGFNYLWRRMETLPVFYPKIDFLIKGVIGLARFVVKIRDRK